MAPTNIEKNYFSFFFYLNLFISHMAEPDIAYLIVVSVFIFSICHFSFNLIIGSANASAKKFFLKTLIN